MFWLELCNLYFTVYMYGYVCIVVQSLVHLLHYKRVLSCWATKETHICITVCVCVFIYIYIYIYIYMYTHICIYVCVCIWGFSYSSVGNESACNAEDLHSVPGSGRCPGEGNVNSLQNSCLENLMDRGACRAIVHRVTRVGHDLATKPPPSVQFSRSVVSDSFRPHEPQHAGPPCLSPTPRVHPNPCSLTWWCHPTISSSVIPFSSCPQSFPASPFFSNESALCIRWPKYWSFNFNISPSNEYSGLISFRMDWLDLLAVQRTLKSLLQHHSSKESILRC